LRSLTYFRGYKIETGKSYIIKQAENTDVTVGFRATVIGEIKDCGNGENNGEMKILHVFHVDDPSRTCEDMAHDEVLNHYICSTTPLESHEHSQKKKKRILSSLRSFLSLQHLRLWVL